MRGLRSQVLHKTMEDTLPPERPKSTEKQRPKNDEEHPKSTQDRPMRAQRAPPEPQRAIREDLIAPQERPITNQEGTNIVPRAGLVPLLSFLSFILKHTLRVIRNANILKFLQYVRCDVEALLAGQPFPFPDMQYLQNGIPSSAHLRNTCYTILKIHKSC